MNEAPAREAEVDHPVLVVLRRDLPLVDVLQHDAVEEEQRRRSRATSAPIVSPRVQLRRSALPRGPVSQRPAAAIAKASGERRELLLADEVAAGERRRARSRRRGAGASGAPGRRARSRARSRGRRGRRRRSRSRTPSRARRPSRRRRRRRRARSRASARAGRSGIAGERHHHRVRVLDRRVGGRCVEWIHQNGAIR